jgi:hypothetical protein
MSNSNKYNASIKPIFIEDFDFTQIEYNPKKKDDKVKTAKTETIYMNINRNSIYLQTPPIEYNQYGYDLTDQEEGDKNVLGFKLPIEDEGLIAKLTAMNAEFQTERVIDKCGLHPKSKLNDIIKCPDPNKPPKFALKIYNDEKRDDNNIQIFDINGMDIETDDLEKNKIEYATFDDIKKIMPFRTIAIYVLKISRMWAKKTKVDPQHGITFIIHKAYIIKSGYVNSKPRKIELDRGKMNKDYIKMLGNSDDDPQTSKKNKSGSSSSSSSKNIDSNNTSSSKNIKSNTKNKPNNDSDLDSNNSEPDANKKPKKKLGKVPVKNESDSDEDSDNIKNQSKNTPQVVARRVADSDEDSDDSASDAESDEEDLKPVNSKAKPKPKVKGKN